MTRRIVIWCVVAVIATAAVVRAAGSLRIVPIVRDDTVVVSFELADAYTDELRDTIAIGLRTTFTYDDDLRMIVPAWVDRTIATAVVTTSDHYDNLTRRHSLLRTVDGHVEESLVTEDNAVVAKWLTTLNLVTLCRTSKLDQSRDYYVRVSARARPHGASLLGWATATTGQAKFTFIP